MKQYIYFAFSSFGLSRLIKKTYQIIQVPIHTGLLRKPTRINKDRAGSFLFPSACSEGVAVQVQHLHLQGPPGPGRPAGRLEGEAAQAGQARPKSWTKKLREEKEREELHANLAFTLTRINDCKDQRSINHQVLPNGSYYLLTGGQGRPGQDIQWHHQQ